MRAIQLLKRFIKKYKNKRNIVYKPKQLLKRKEFLGHLPKMKNSKIIFNGKNNILFCEEDVNLVNCTITFNSDNSLIYLSKNSHSYIFNISIYNDSVCYFGKNIYFNSISTLILSEGKNIFIGDNCLISLNVWFRLADPHLIYDNNSKKRINLSKSIYIGDHVWIGQNVFLLKGCMIGSGSILAANSVISNKNVSSNSIYGGNPVKKIKSNIFWDEHVVHRYKEEDTKNSIFMKTDDYSYKNSKNTISFDEIEKKLVSEKDVLLKLEILKKISNDKNRFYME